MDVKIHPMMKKGIIILNLKPVLNIMTNCITEINARQRSNHMTGGDINHFPGKGIFIPPLLPKKKKKHTVQEVADYFENHVLKYEWLSGRPMK